VEASFEGRRVERPHENLLKGPMNVKACGKSTGRSGEEKKRNIGRDFTKGHGKVEAGRDALLHYRDLEGYGTIFESGLWEESGQYQGETIREAGSVIRKRGGRGAFPRE